jgi:transcriptional regulator
MKTDTLYRQTTFANKDFPFSIKQILTQNGQPDILFHWHTDIEIIYVSEGTAQFHIDYEYFDSQAGDIILIRPNALHSIHPIQRDSHTMDVLHFNLDLVGISHKNIATLKYLQPLYNGDFEFARRIQPDAPGYEEIKSCLLDCMKNGRDQGPFYELRIKSQLNELLYLLYSHHYIVEKKFSTEAYRREEKIRLVLDHISDHYQEELMIEQLAELCNFSPTHFMNFFKKQLGISCMEYIIQFRLKKAAHLLQHSDQAIIEIASQSGFNNLSNFNRQFKKYYETTPSHYRKACL